MLKSFVTEFRSFISRGNVVDLAIGITMGAAFTAIVTSLVQDVLMPPIGLDYGRWTSPTCFSPLTGKTMPA